MTGRKRCKMGLFDKFKKSTKEETEAKAKEAGREFDTCVK